MVLNNEITKLYKKIVYFHEQFMWVGGFEVILIIIRFIIFLINFDTLYSNKW